MNFKKTIAGTLTAAMLLSQCAFAASPSDFTDFPNDWSTTALTHAVENGLLVGSDGKINASGKLTRAEMATIVNRAFQATESASIAGFSDVSSNAWYASEFAKAVQMGTFNGSGDKLNPTNAITREEAFVVLARAFALEDGSSSALSSFGDASSVSSWAEGGVAALVAGGYVNGSGGKINPKASITRAEFAQIMDNLVDTYAASAADVSGSTVSGNLIVTAGMTLTGVSVNGDLILADGVGSGVVTLDGVSVTGRILVRGGSVDMVNGKGGDVVVKNPNTTSTVTSDAKLSSVTLYTSATTKADASAITVKDSAKLSVASGTVDKVTTDSDASSPSVSVAKGATVTTVDANAAGTTVSGEGSVVTVNANANNVAVTTANTVVKAASSTSGVTAAGVSVPAGETGTINSDATSATVTKTATADNSTSSSSSGGGSTSVTKINTWSKLRKAVANAKDGATIKLTGNITDAGVDENIYDGTTSATLNIATKGITINGAGYTISNKDGSATFCMTADGDHDDEGNATVTGVTVKNLTIDGGSFSTKLGGAFFVQDGVDVTFDGVTFKNCAANSASTAVTGGGAIFINDHGAAGTTAIIKNCTFIDNTSGDGSTGRGGAIYADNFRSSSMKLVVENSTFEGNKAAYGGAIAVDGIVDVTLTGNTFKGNEGTYADDVYIFDGQSAGKKGMNILSEVTVSDISGNTYTNEDDTDVTVFAKMNIIFGRYYGLGYSSYNKATADVMNDITMHDYLFVDTDRTTRYDASATPKTVSLSADISYADAAYVLTISDVEQAYYNAATKATLTVGEDDDAQTVALSTSNGLSYNATEKTLTVTVDASNVTMNASGILETDTVLTVEIEALGYETYKETATVTNDDLSMWSSYTAGFETFLNYLTADALTATWEDIAAQMSTEEKTVTAESLTDAWSAMCTTTTDGQSTEIATTKVVGNTVTFMDADGDPIASYDYRIVEMVAAGLEGGTTYILKTDANDAGVFTYLGMMAPDYDSDGIPAHFHFRYAANKDDLDLSNASNYWYPTMVDATATDDAKSAMLYAMYKLTPSTTDEDEDETTTKEVSAEVEIYGYTAKLLVTLDVDGKIVSVTDNGTEAGSNSASYWANATALFDSLVGKSTATEVTAVDGISQATYSSNAIKTAVADAFH